MSENTPPQPPAFERGYEHPDRLRSDPQISAGVAQAHAEAEEMDRIYAMNLAMIRKAAQMTQVEVARELVPTAPGQRPAEPGHAARQSCGQMQVRRRLSRVRSARVG